MSRYKDLLKDKKLLSGIYMVSLLTALLILAVVIKGPEESGTLVSDSSGNIIGINRSSLKRNERYDLNLEIQSDEETENREVTLALQAVQEGNKVRSNQKEERAAEIDAEIENIISSIEYSKKKKIRLPTALSDGTALRWTAVKKDSGAAATVIPIMYISLVALMILNSIKGDRTSSEERKSILRGLPRFCNQLYLMMNAGLILSDAFDTISAEYISDIENRSRFEQDVAELCEATEGHRISTAQVISEYAVRHDVKEMVRIAAILTENEKRGSDVIESLERESRYLWEERKTVARESGKAIDTRMSYPLGLLLIVLIVITMAPALLNM